MDLLPGGPPSAHNLQARRRSEIKQLGAQDTRRNQQLPTFIAIPTVSSLDATEGLDSVDKWPNLTRALLEEGYTAAEIRKIYGENTLRLMGDVERVAKSTR